ncbi:MAG: hypothetical protein ACRCVX_16115 [Shewanella sp.]
MRYLLLHGTKQFESLAYAQNALSFELESLADYLRCTAGAEVHIASPHNVATVPLAEFDSIILNGFGNGDSICEAWLLQTLPAFAGQVYWLMSDPAFFAVPERHLPQTIWQDRLTGLFAGQDLARYDKACRQMQAQHACHWTLPASRTQPLPQFWTHMWQKVAHEQSSPVVKPFDLCYAGRARSPERMQIVEWLVFGSGLQALTIGFEPSVRSTKVTTKPVLPFRQTLTEQRKAISTIVLGDPGYEQLLPRPHRLLQAWALRLVAFVYEPFDAKRECLRAMPEHLQNMLYVSSPVHLRRMHQAFASDPGLIGEILAWQKRLL